MEKKIHVNISEWGLTKQYSRRYYKHTLHVCMVISNSLFFSNVTLENTYNSKPIFEIKFGLIQGSFPQRTTFEFVASRPSHQASLPENRQMSVSKTGGRFHKQQVCFQSVTYQKAYGTTHFSSVIRSLWSTIQLRWMIDC